MPLEMKDEEIRVLRILEYRGSRKAIEQNLNRRGVKIMKILADYSIAEAIIGDTFEVLSDAKLEYESPFFEGGDA